MAKKASKNLYSKKSMMNFKLSIYMRKQIKQKRIFNQPQIQKAMIILRKVLIYHLYLTKKLKFLIMRRKMKYLMKQLHKKI